MAVLTEKQQNLIKNNSKLLLHYLQKKKITHSIPSYLEDTFESDLGWYFCIAALKFKKAYGFKFSTYAYGAFDLCWQKLKLIEKNKFTKSNYIDSRNIIHFVEKQDIRQKVKNLYLDKNAIYSLIENANLTHREKLIMVTYFFDNYSIRKTGELFKISGARIHQILKRIRHKLKRTAVKQKLEYNDFYKSV